MTSISAKKFCNLPAIKQQVFEINVDRGRRELILANNKKWVNGTKLTYYFFESRNMRGTEEEKQSVRDGFVKWKNIGIGLDFEEVQNKRDAIVRIAFLNGDGSWSYVGRDNWDINKNNRTMNFGWDITNSEGFDTVLHEIGHALGFPHEHQNPNAGIQWNRTIVIQDLSGPPNNWDVAKIEHNVLIAKRADEVRGSDIDEDSIMMYSLKASWIDGPEHLSDGINPEPGLSTDDKKWVRKFYPGTQVSDFEILELYKSEQFNINPGEQANFLIKPTATREYNIRTFGELDTIMVLFERDNGEEIYLSADDDSGENYNSAIKIRLEEGKEYVVRIRLYTQWGTGNTSIIIY